MSIMKDNNNIDLLSSECKCGDNFFIKGLVPSESQSELLYSKNKKNIKQDVNYPCKLQHLRKRELKIKQTFHFTTITDRANPEGL